MPISYGAVAAGDPIYVLDAEQVCDAGIDDDPGPAGTYSITSDNGGDGVCITGAPPQLHEWLNRARTTLVKATNGPRVLTVIDLSTSHLPEDVCDDLNGYDGVTAYKTTYGWLLYVPGPDERNDRAPVVVQRLWEYAYRFGATYILLDRDADQVDDLPTWRW